MASGKCFCGAVRFEVSGAPKWVAHCHCSMCRRAHAAGYVTWAGYPETALRLTAGAGEITVYRSSPPARRAFCRVCGSQLFFRHEGFVGEVHIPLALFDDDIGMKPAAHVFFSDRVDWMPVHDALKKKGGASGLEPL